MPVRLTTCRAGVAHGTATSHAGETYRFVAVAFGGDRSRVLVTLYGAKRNGHERKMPREALVPLKAEIARACRHAKGWEETHKP